MKLLGIGTDIVEVARMQQLLQRQAERAAARILHPLEYERFQMLAPDKQPAWLAKRFATKEALAKALGTGIGEYAQLCDIETRHSEQGKPELYLHGVTQATADCMGVNEIALTLADERHYAVAFVILIGSNE